MLIFCYELFAMTTAKKHPQPLGASLEREVGRGGGRQEHQ